MFEYKVIPFGAAENLDQQFNSLAGDGWRLAHVAPTDGTAYFIFEREKSSSKSPK